MTKLMNSLLAEQGVSRRTFLQVTALGSAGFLIGCGEAGKETAAGAAAETADLNAFVRVGADDTVTVIVKHLDKGQGVTTGLPTIVAEEMDAAWEQTGFEFAPADAQKYANFAFGVQGTGGSTSVANSWMQLRKAAGAARAMLVQAAADEWGVDPAEITVSKGKLRHEGSGKSATFGSFAAGAAKIAPPEEPKLKDPKDFTLIGTRVPRMDSAAKTDGSARFSMDEFPEGALVAVIARPPKFGGKAVSFNAGEVKNRPGVKDVVAIPRGVAVLATGYWEATQARKALKVEWDFSNAETRGSEELMALYRELANEPGATARNDGDAEAALSGAAKVIEADYEFPYLAHAPMEPLNCVVKLSEDKCEIWAGSQIQTLDQMTAAGIAGLKPEQVSIKTMYAGGSFGRRAIPDSDFVAEGVMVAKAINGRAPVKLMWSREDDVRGGRYRPMNFHRLRAGVDEEGNIVAWHHRLVGQSIMSGTALAEEAIKDGIDNSSVEGAQNLPYAVPNLRVELATPEVGVPVLWWRSVGHTHTAFSTETFLDELAEAAGRDPVALRRELLKDHPRHLGVLNLAAEKSGWGAPLEAGRGRGVAVHESFNSYVAQVVEVTARENGEFTVDRVVCAVDCGIAVNPDVIAAQMEGGLGYGLSAALREQVTLVDGEVQEDNFNNYMPLRINEMPEVEVHIVPSGEAPTGVGEPGLPPLAPALANALYAATGKRIRKLP
ncbi:MAG: molybdopterin cofactor-binding domain-containing protein, partial [Alphaproteobacteria bacterium]